MLVAGEVKTLAHESKSTEASFVHSHVCACLEPVNVLLFDALDSLLSALQLTEVELSSRVREVLPFKAFLDNAPILHIHFQVGCVRIVVGPLVAFSYTDLPLASLHSHVSVASCRERLLGFFEVGRFG